MEPLVGEPSPAATPRWKGAAFTYVRNCFAVRTAASSSGLAHAQPTFQPVHENVLPPDEMVTVRSRMPGERRERHVLTVEHEVLVDLVGHGEEVVLDTRARDHFELGAARTPCPSGCAASSAARGAYAA